MKVTQDLYAIRITPQDDIVTEAKLNVQTIETEILLYDIYVCNQVFFIQLKLLHCLSRHKMIIMQ